MTLRVLKKGALYALGTRERVVAYLRWASGPRQTASIIRVCRLALGSVGYILKTLTLEGQIRHVTRGQWQATEAPRDLLRGLHRVQDECR